MPVSLVAAESFIARAVRWDGTVEALQDLQQLLCPASPLLRPCAPTERRTESIGVYVSWPTTRRYPYVLEWAEIGSWIVRRGDRVEIVTPEEFVHRYTTQATGEVQHGTTP